MATYTQAVRPLRVTTPLGPDALLLVGLSGHEAISRLFQFRLDLLAENETAVPFEKLLGQKVTVELGIPDQDVRYFSGICSRVSQGGRDQTFTAYHLEVVPQLWFLTRIAQSRIFQQLTVPDILKKVLKGLDVELPAPGHVRAARLLRAVPRDRLRLRQPAHGRGGHLLLLPATRPTATSWSWPTRRRATPTLPEPA